VVLKSPKVGFQQPKYSLGIQCVHARRPQTDYEALLPLHETSRFGDALLNTAKVIFEAHGKPHDTRWAIAAFFRLFLATPWL
jgi:hypothetical protein